MKRKHCYLEKRKRGKDKQYEHYKKMGNIHQNTREKRCVLWTPNLKKNTNQIFQKLSHIGLEK